MILPAAVWWTQGVYTRPACASCRDHDVSFPWYMHDTFETNQCEIARRRFCAAARAALHKAVPRHPGFLELALQHQYPLRSLITSELPNCALGPYLAEVQGGGMRFDDLLSSVAIC